MKKIISLAANFSQKLKQIVGGIKAGVQFFKDLISGRLSLKKIVDDMIDAITSIPKKVNIFKIWFKKKAELVKSWSPILFLIFLTEV